MEDALDGARPPASVADKATGRSLDTIARDGAAQEQAHPERLEPKQAGPGLAEPRHPERAEADDAPGDRDRAPTQRSGAAETQTPRPATGGAAEPGSTRAKQQARRAKYRGRGPLFAALDLGTNNCRLLVARPDKDGFQVVDAFSRVVRLGEGLNDTGMLSPAAMERAVAALSVCADRIQKHRVVRFRAIATEACRRAGNQRAFLDRVRSETGLFLDVIAAEEEARLAVAGCAPLFETSLEQLLVFDIGGGSTELIWVDLAKTSAAKRRSLLMALAHGASRSDRARAAAQHITDWISLPVGVVTLGEKFDRIIDDAEKFEAMYAHVRELLEPFIDKSHGNPLTQDYASPQERLAKLQVLGTSGTITTLAGVHLDLERYSRRAVDGLWVASSAVDRVIQRLLEMNAYERAAIPCVGEDRATHLMSGAAILRAILRAWPTRRLRVADRGLREGMLYGLIQDGAGRWQNRRRPS